MIKNTQIKVHSESLISIRDNINDVDIGDSKWNSIFQHLISEHTICCFCGYDRWSELNSEFIADVENYTISNLYNDPQLLNVFFQIDIQKLFLARGGIGSLWKKFEYPSIFFLRNKANIALLRSLCVKRIGINEITCNVPHCSAIFKSFEEDVLWISHNDPIENIIKELLN